MAEIDDIGDIKRIIFEDTDKRHADLKIRLHYDEIKQGEFFRLMLTGYINQDERLMSYIEDYKEQKKIQSKRKITDSRRLRKKAQEIENKFALNSEEVEDIFDLIEKENQDL